MTGTADRHGGYLDGMCSVRVQASLKVPHLVLCVGVVGFGALGHFGRRYINE